jgi:hypothetical protein
MVLDALGVVTRGAPKGTRCCEGCGLVAPELMECRVPYSTKGGGRAQCYWRDLCQECVAKLREMPALPKGGKAAADAAWETALALLKKVVQTPVSRQNRSVSDNEASPGRDTQNRSGIASVT